MEGLFWCQCWTNWIHQQPRLEGLDRVLHVSETDFSLEIQGGPVQFERICRRNILEIDDLHDEEH